MALSLEGVTEKDHHGADSFYRSGLIFMTAQPAKNIVNFRFTPEQQSQFLARDGEAFEEIDNKWGKIGWTQVNMEFIETAEFKEALKAAWGNMAPKAKKFSYAHPPKAAKKKSKSSSAKPSRRSPARKAR